MTGVELVLLEQGERAALYARWPSVFTVALNSSRHPQMTRTLTDLHNAVTDGRERLSGCGR